MELRRMIAPTSGFMPAAIRERLYNEQWQKDRLEVSLLAQEEALSIKTKPLPYLELMFGAANRFPIPVQIFGASVEVWLGKPVVQFYSFLSESLRPGEERSSLRAYTFLNNYQAELLNPPKKESPPPAVTLIVTLSCRSSFGQVEKTVKSNWLVPRVI